MENVFFNTMESQTSPYRRGAHTGAFFGLYLCAIFMAMVASAHLVLASFVFFVLMAGVPVFIYFALRRGYVSRSGRASVSELWVEGIMIFIFGSAICGFVTFIYLKWIEPTFMYDQVTSIISSLQALRNNPQLMAGQDVGQIDSMIDVFSNMVTHGMVPKASEFVMSMFWFTTATGCILSLPLAFFARLKKIPEVGS